MILTGIISVLLLLSFIEGWRRGLFLELMNLLAAAVSFVAASLLYQEYSAKLVDYFSLTVPSESLTILNDAIVKKATAPFFAAFTWFIIFIGANVVLHLFLLLVRRFAGLLSFGKPGRFIAGLLSLIVCYFGIQLCLTLLSLFPLANLQNFLASSDFARWMVLKTPISSGALLKLFVENMIHLSPY
ncbi:CvpA family protein [Lactovum odontotermitis]